MGLRARSISAILGASILLSGVACGTDRAGEPSDASPLETPRTTVPSPSPTLDPSAYPVVVGPESVAGWWTGSGWVLAEGRMAEIPALEGETYRVVRLADPLTTASGSSPSANCETVPGAASVDIPGLVRELGQPPPVAVSDVPNPRPREVEILDAGREEYRRATSELLARKGAEDAEVRVVQAVGGDLDSDGRTEVVLVAERIDDPQLFGRPGDYSLVFLHRADQAGRPDAVIKEIIPDPGPGEAPYVVSHRVSALADLNGDGRMEVAVSAREYEGAGMTIHELRPDGSVVEVLRSWCGA